jgi:hypothetical protein
MDLLLEHLGAAEDFRGAVTMIAHQLDQSFAVRVH